MPGDGEARYHQARRLSIIPDMVLAVSYTLTLSLRPHTETHPYTHAQIQTDRLSTSKLNIEWLSRCYPEPQYSCPYNGDLNKKEFSKIYDWQE